MRLLTLGITLSFYILPLIVRGQNYPISTIPSELLNNANAVIRENSEEFTIISKKESRTKIRLVVTILNEKAKGYGFVLIPYDKFSKIEKVKVNVYDEAGAPAIKMKQSELLDVSYVSSYSLYEDNRIKAFDPKYNRYPYTIEYEYQSVQKGSLFYPKWDPIPRPEVAVENSSFEVIAPSALKFRYKNINCGKPDSVLKGENWTYKWSLKNLKSKKAEAFGEDFYSLVPSVVTAPLEFELDGYPGSMKTWDEFGKWIISLNTNRNILDPKTESDLLKLVKNEDDIKTKVQKVYGYLQSRTRYVSIQLGIGGFQPFPANVVGEKGYGDCKALSNYTKAMLEKLGIKSHYTLVRAGEDERDIYPDFPSVMFNHAFLCVPVEGDTLWLECTSQSGPFGYLGSFTNDRHVLLITETGGKIVKTPTYSREDNLQIRKGVVKLDENGNASATIRTTYKGLQYENNHINFMITKSLEDQKKWIYEKLKMNNFSLNSFNFTTRKERIPSIDENLDLSLRNYGSKSGKRMFLQPNLLNKLNIQIPKYETRESDLLIKQPFVDVDTIEYTYPSKYFLEFTPEKTEIKTEFGYFTSEIRPSDGKMIYIRKFSLDKGRYPKEKYNEFADFLKKVKQADHLKLVFVDKT